MAPPQALPSSIPIPSGAFLAGESSVFTFNCPPTPPQRRKPLTFRNSKIIYYGPHACSNCGIMICKMGSEFGGSAFTYPDDGPIYPNTEWNPHVCDPELVELQKAATEVTP